MKSNQYCSVCKQWLDMEVVSSGDPEEDDGVTWYRCPGCQGFLPKLNAAAETDAAATAPKQGTETAAPADPAESPVAASGEEPVLPEDDLPWDSPEEMLDAAAATSPAEVSATLAGLESDEPAGGTEPAGDKGAADPNEAGKGEPIAEYAAMLEAADVEAAVPYRPWDSYELGQCILHLAWNDCGVVVGKESLPGGRQAVKCYFSEAGVVRLIENDHR